MTVQLATQTDNSNQTFSISGPLGNADKSSFLGMPAQQATFTVQGTFGAATVVVQASYDGGTTFYTLKDANGTAMSYISAPTNPIPLTVPAGALVQVSSSGGSGTSVTWYLAGAKTYF